MRSECVPVRTKKKKEKQIIRSSIEKQRIFKRKQMSINNRTLLMRSPLFGHEIEM